MYLQSTSVTLLVKSFSCSVLSVPMCVCLREISECRGGREEDKSAACLSRSQGRGERRETSLWSAGLPSAFLPTPLSLPPPPKGREVLQAGAQMGDFRDGGKSAHERYVQTRRPQKRCLYASGETRAEFGHISFPKKACRYLSLLYWPLEIVPLDETLSTQAFFPHQENLFSVGLSWKFFLCWEQSQKLPSRLFSLLRRRQIRWGEKLFLALLPSSGVMQKLALLFVQFFFSATVWKLERVECTYYCAR